MKTQRFEKYARGFTLVESVIALGILVVLITGFLAVFGPAAEVIRKTLSVDEASRLQSSLEWELTHLREGGEKQRYQDDPFRKAMTWIGESHDKDTTVIIYKYKALPGQIRTDGTLEPAEPTPSVAGKDFVLQPMVRRLNDSLLEADLKAAEGRVFFVKLRQLVFQGEGLRVSEDIGTVTDPHDPGEDFSNKPEEYPEAVVVFEAEYYTLPATSYAFLTGSFDPANYNRPIFARNLSVSR